MFYLSVDSGWLILSEIERSDVKLFVFLVRRIVFGPYCLNEEFEVYWTRI